MTRKLILKGADAFYTSDAIYNRENKVNLSKTDMTDILSLSEDDTYLQRALKDIQSYYFLKYSDRAHAGGYDELAPNDIQKWSMDKISEHNITVDILKVANNLGW